MEFTDIQKLLITKSLEIYRDGTIDFHLKDLLQEIIDIMNRDKEPLEKLDELKISLRQEFLELLPYLNTDEYLEIDHILLAATFRIIEEESEMPNEKH